jgi:hypothetical protein
MSSSSLLPFADQLVEAMMSMGHTARTLGLQTFLTEDRLIDLMNGAKPSTKELDVLTRQLRTTFTISM